MDFSQKISDKGRASIIHCLEQLDVNNWQLWCAAPQIDMKESDAHQKVTERQKKLSKRPIKKVAKSMESKNFRYCK